MRLQERLEGRRDLKATWHNTRVFLLAHFVTIWPRTFYPCVNMYLGTIYISTEFQPDRTSNMAARQPFWKTNKVLLLLNYWLDHLQIFITGTSNKDFYWISARSDFKYGRQVAILVNQQCAITPEVMAGSSPNLYYWCI
jgi:hypothetical protein